MKSPKTCSGQLLSSGRRILGLAALAIGLAGLTSSVRAQLYSQNFSGGTAPGWTVALGTWSVVTGTPSYYTETSNTGGPNVSYYSTLTLPDTGFSYASSLYVHGAGTANCSGVVYYYQSTNNYYEVELNPISPTGTVQLYEHINNAAGSIVATASYSCTPSTYQAVVVSRSGSTTTIKVNGTTLFTRTQTALTGGGEIGASDRWISPRITSIVVTDTQAPTVSITAPANNATVSGTTSVTATAADNVAVASVQFQLDGVNLGSAITASPYTYSWDTTTASNASHSLTAIAKDTSNNSTTSSTVTVTVSNGLPSGWSAQDIGSPGAAGSTSYSSGTFTVKGAGTGPWFTSDQFQYAYVQLTGDCSVVAKVISVTSTNGAAGFDHGGVMIRETLNANSTFVGAYETSEEGLLMEGRTTTGGSAAGFGWDNTHLTPYWVKLTRGGNVFTAYSSSDGSTWTVLGTPQTVSMASSVYAGLAVSSDVSNVTSTAVYTNVTAATGDFTPPSVSITSPADNATVAGTTTVSATASDNVGVSSVQFQLDSANLGSAITTAPYNYTWDTTTASNASHVLTAIASDAAGNQTTSAGSFATVSNGGGTVLGGSYSINFNGGTAPSWTAASGTWSVSGGTYNNTAYNTSTGRGIAVYTGETWNTDYIIRATVKNGLSAAGNYNGLIFNYVDANNFYTLIFDVQGYAELDKCVSGTVSTIATAASGTFGGGHLSASTWEDVEVNVTGTNATVHIQGARVFNNVSLSGSALPTGEIGCYTQWSTGSFDNFSVTQIPNVAYNDGFASGSTTGWSGSQGTWSASSPYYVETAYNTATGEAISTYGTTTWNNNYTYSASVYTVTSGATNDVGVIFNYVDANNYYDVIVSATGIVELDKKISGTLTVVSTTAAGAYPGYGTKKWVDICVLRQVNNNTSVFVNGKGIFGNVALTQLGAGDIGFKATYNSTGKFQFVTVSNGLVPYKRIMPKLAGTFNGGNLHYDSFESTLAAYDMVNLGIYNGWSHGTPAALVSAVKALNPATLIANYSNVVSEYSPVTSGAVDYDVYSYLGAQTGPTGNGGTWTPNDWWARTSTGATTTFFSGQNDTNLTYFVTPDTNGLRYPQYFANREDAVLYSGVGYDLFFTDCALYVDRSDADWDRNGTTDNGSNSTVEAYFRQGIVDYYQRLTQLEPGMLIYANIDGRGSSFGHLSSQSPEYQGYVPIAMDEGAMGASWSEETWAGWSFAQGSYQSEMDGSAWPNLISVVVYGTSTGTSHYTSSTVQYGGGANYAFMRYALCSTLLENGYLSYCLNGNYDVSATQSFDEYNVILGEPLQGAQRTPWSNGVYERLFQNGLALLNPRSNGQQTVNVTTLGSGLFKHFSGTQDSTTNNGANVTTVTVKDGDGLILINQ